MDKPEALLLADALEAQATWVPSGPAGVMHRSAAELRRLHAENAALAAALASSCDEQRHELWESGGVAGCERARLAERQRDALLEALKLIVEFVDAPTEGKRPDVFVMRISKARAAIKNAEGGQ
jgi:hypothetical protein